MKVVMMGLYPPHVGGISSYVYNLKKGLESLGLTIYVVTYGKKTDQYGTFVLPFLRGPSFVVTGTKKVLEIIRKEKVDLIHAHYLVPPGLVGVFAKKVSHIPLVVTCHGSDVFVFSTGWKRKISQYVIERSDCIVANSKATFEAVEKMGGTAVKYIPSGVDLTKFKPETVKREAVTYVGALTRTKGVDIFLRAMEGISEKVWIIGDGPERKSLESLGKKLGIDCTFWGFRMDVPHFLNRSKIVVLPSREEGFGLSLLEAMACGTPVIGRKRGGIPELINGQNGLLFETEEELHETILNLIGDKKRWRALREKGLETASQWSWEKTAQSYAEIFKSLTQGAASL